MRTPAHPLVRSTGSGEPINSSLGLSGDEVAAKERELIGDRRLVGLAVVDIEVIDARVGAQLA